jgi:hypothetical protein
MIDLKEYINRQSMIESALLKINELTSSQILNLKACNIAYAVNSLINERNVTRAKQFYFNGALLDAYNIINHQSKLLDYSDISYTLLSDNWNYLEKKYSKLRYSSYYIDDKTNEETPLLMDEMILHGDSAIWCNTIQLFMAKDFEGIDRNLKIIETKTLAKLPKNQKELRIDYELYKAFLLKDKAKCEMLLEQLVSPKIHKKRNINGVLSQYVSQPALGYAKLAWRLGIEVEVDSPLIPKEILPIEPLDNYEIPYDFLKD